MITSTPMKTFAEWFEANKKYTNPEDMDAWLETAFNAGQASNNASNNTDKLSASQLLILRAGLISGKLGAAKLAAQLAGVPACDKCGYVQSYCWCGIRIDIEGLT